MSQSKRKVNPAAPDTSHKKTKVFDWVKLGMELLPLIVETVKAAKK